MLCFSYSRIYGRIVYVWPNVSYLERLFPMYFFWYQSTFYLVGDTLSDCSHLLFFIDDNFVNHHFYNLWPKLTKIFQTPMVVFKIGNIWSDVSYKTIDTTLTKRKRSLKPNLFDYGGYGNGSQSHRRSSMTRDSICIWNPDGSKFEPLIFPLFSIRNTDHVFFYRNGSLFYARKNWDGSKFESFCLEFNFSPNFEPSRFFRA